MTRPTCFRPTASLRREAAPIVLLWRICTFWATEPDQYGLVLAIVCRN